jgi:hypothetical protein
MALSSVGARVAMGARGVQLSTREMPIGVARHLPICPPALKKSKGSRGVDMSAHPSITGMI